MDGSVLEIGVGAVVALMVIKEVIPHLRRNGSPKDCALSKVCEMRHDVLKDLLLSVNENISAQTALLRALCQEMREIKNRLPKD